MSKSPPIDPLAVIRQLPDGAMRHAALQALMLLGDEALPVIIQALDHPAWQVRAAAAAALGEINSSTALPDLLHTLGDPEDAVRKSARRVLEQFGEEAIPGLGEALYGADDRRRREASRVLGQIGGAAIPLLVEAIYADAPEIRAAAADALGQLDPRAEADRLQAAGALLDALQDADNDVCRVAARSLGRIGPGLKDEEARAAVVAGLVSVLGDWNEFVRRIAAWALGEMHHPAAVESLAISLSEDADQHVRRIAAQSLGRIGDRRAIRALIAALRDADMQVRARAANALGNLGAEEAVEELGALLNGVAEISPGDVVD